MIILIAVALFFVRCSSNESVTPNKDKEDVTFQKKAKDNEIKVISFNVRYETTEAYPYNNWDYRKVDCVTLIKEQGTYSYWVPRSNLQNAMDLFKGTVK
jgi:hypothetical protein